MWGGERWGEVVCVCGGGSWEVVLWQLATVNRCVRVGGCPGCYWGCGAYWRQHGRPDQLMTPAKCC